MRIGIVGSGMIGGTAARLLAGAGHDVAVSGSRGPAALDELVGTLGGRGRAVTPAEAVRFGDVVLLAIPWRRRDELPDGALFAGKIVIDAMNPYGDGGVIDVEPSTSSEEVAKLMPEARLVKAFNTLYYRRLAEDGRPGAPPGERVVLFLAGDDAGAKDVVARLIDELGFAAYDTGSLADGGRRQQPGSPVYNVPLTTAQADTLLR